jgi:hypothetical protein
MLSHKEWPGLVKKAGLITQGFTAWEAQDTMKGSEELDNHSFGGNYAMVALHGGYARVI